MILEDVVVVAGGWRGVDALVEGEALSPGEGLFVNRRTPIRVPARLDEKAFPTCNVPPTVC